jgi:hypothetical protein
MDMIAVFEYQGSWCMLNYPHNNALTVIQYGDKHKYVNIGKGIGDKLNNKINVVRWRKTAISRISIKFQME